MQFAGRWRFRAGLLLLTLVARVAGAMQREIAERCTCSTAPRAMVPGAMGRNHSLQPSPPRRQICVYFPSRCGNPLPEDVIAKFIDGRSDVKAHGPRDMPVWGRNSTRIRWR